MKRIQLTVLAFILCFAFFPGCVSIPYEGPVSCKFNIETGEEPVLVNLTEDAQKTILSILNKGQWENGVSNCGCDFEFTTKHETIRYHSACGTFNDIPRHRIMELSDADKRIINTLLDVANTNANRNSETRLSIVMTIAETLPSCFAFEYKGEKPYCLYAYDGDGNLYRVFWNNFDGLNEKDQITVDYYRDTIVTLRYDEYTSGWTPQFEVTAINVVSEEERNKTAAPNN